MLPAPLDNLVKIDELEVEPRSQAEIDGLIRSGEARLKDAEIAALSSESRFDLLYNAAHAFSLAALRHRGYRPRKKRYVVFQALAHTLDLPAEQWRCSLKPTTSATASNTRAPSRRTRSSSKRCCALRARLRSASAFYGSVRRTPSNFATKRFGS